MQKSVTIISIINTCSETEQVLSLNSNLKAAGYDFKLIVLINGVRIPKNIIDAIDKRIKEIDFLLEPLELSISAALNELLRKTETELVCFLPTNLYLDKNWLTEMVKYHSIIDRTGLSVINDLKKGYYSHVLNENGDLDSVIIPNSYSESDCFMLDQGLIMVLGAFDECLHSGYQVTDYADRAIKLNYQNFILPKTNTIKIKINSIPAWVTLNPDYEKHIAARKSNFIQLVYMSEALKLARLSIDKLIKNLKKSLLKYFGVTNPLVNEQLNQNNGNFSVITYILTELEIIIITKFAKAHKIAYYIKSNGQKIECVFTNKNE